MQDKYKILTGHPYINIGNPQKNTPETVPEVAGVTMVSLGNRLRLTYPIKQVMGIGTVGCIKNVISSITHFGYPTSYVAKTRLTSAEMTNIKSLRQRNTKNYKGILAYTVAERIFNDKPLQEDIRAVFTTTPDTVITALMSKTVQVFGKTTTVDNYNVRLFTYADILGDIVKLIAADDFTMETAMVVVTKYSDERVTSVFEDTMYDSVDIPLCDRNKIIPKKSVPKPRTVPTTVITEDVPEDDGYCAVGDNDDGGEGIMGLVPEPEPDDPYDVIPTDGVASIDVTETVDDKSTSTNA